MAPPALSTAHAKRAALRGPAVYRVQLARELAAEAGISVALAQRTILPTLCRIISAHVIAGRRVVLPRIGQFYTKRVGERLMPCNLPGRGPYRVRAGRTPAFKPSDILKEAVRLIPSRRDGRQPSARPGTPPGREAAS